MHFVAFCLSENSFLDNNEPEDDTTSEMDHGNLNSTLVLKSKKGQKRFLHEDFSAARTDRSTAQIKGT